MDPEYLKDRKVYGHVLAAFRYGREDLDVLGLTFRKDLYLASSQIYPPEDNSKKPLSRLQVMSISTISTKFKTLFKYGNEDIIKYCVLHNSPWEIYYFYRKD